MLSHLPIVQIESWIPLAAAVVAAPIQKLCPKYLLQSMPTSWRAPLKVDTNLCSRQRVTILESEKGTYAWSL